MSTEEQPPAPSNYKGILLSNRPPATGNDSPVRGGIDSSSPPPFMPSGTARHIGSMLPQSSLGLAPSKEQSMANAAAKLHLESKMKDAPKLSVTYQHKQYLKDLQTQKQMENIEKAEKEIEREEKKKKFQDSQKKLRQILKESNYSTNEIKKFLKTGSILSKETKPQEKPSQEEKKIPAWYSQKKQEETQEEELEDLLNFAENLDFESYIDDFEVREAVGVIHARVKEMEEELTEEEKESRRKEREERIQKIRAERRQEANTSIDHLYPTTTQTERPDWDSSTKISQQDTLQAMDMNQVPQPLNRIHSKASINTVAKQSQKSSKYPPEEPKEIVIERMIEELHRDQAARESTLIVTHDSRTNEPHVPMAKSQRMEATSKRMEATSKSPEGESERVLVRLRKDPDYVQNLPYMYRCPSI